MNAYIIAWNGPESDGFYKGAGRIVKLVDMDVKMAVYCGWFDNGAAGAFCAGDAGKYGYKMDMDAKGEKTDG